VCKKIDLIKAHPYFDPVTIIVRFADQGSLWFLSHAAASGVPKYNQYLAGLVYIGKENENQFGWN
jgi:hypothetical protein